MYLTQQSQWSWQFEINYIIGKFQNNYLIIQTNKFGILYHTFYVVVPYSWTSDAIFFIN